MLNELRQRTADLTEALEQQTATSQVLQVISSSPDDLEPVFAAMLEKAGRIGEAAFGNIYRWEGETGHLVATYNTPQAFAEERRNAPDWRPAPESPVDRLLTSKSVVHVTDLASESDDPNLVEIADQFELIGKPVWRYLAEVPRAAG